MTITLTREEAQQVLDALDEYRDSTEDFRVANRCISLIETLRARLSAPEPEPVAWMNDCADFWQQYICFNEIAQERLVTEAREWIEKLRTAPPQRERVQFPTMLR